MKDWLKWLIVGLLSVAFGVFVLGNAVLASVAVTSVTGLLFLLSGSFQIIAGLGTDTTRGSKAFALLLGLLMVLLGLSFLFNPLQGVLSLSLLILVILAAGGITRIVFSWRMRETRLFWPMLISGALSVLLAGYILANFAAIGPELLGILLGVELLFNGAGMIVLSLFIRAFRDKFPK